MGAWHRQYICGWEHALWLLAAVIGGQGKPESQCISNLHRTQDALLHAYRQFSRCADAGHAMCLQRGFTPLAGTDCPWWPETL